MTFLDLAFYFFQISYKKKKSRNQASLRIIKLEDWNLIYYTSYLGLISF